MRLTCDIALPNDAGFASVVLDLAAVPRVGEHISVVTVEGPTAILLVEDVYWYDHPGPEVAFLGATVRDHDADPDTWQMFWDAYRAERIVATEQ